MYLSLDFALVSTANHKTPAIAISVTVFSFGVHWKKLVLATQNRAVIPVTHGAIGRTSGLYSLVAALPMAALARWIYSGPQHPSQVRIERFRSTFGNQDVHFGSEESLHDAGKREPALPLTRE